MSIDRESSLVLEHRNRINSILQFDVVSMKNIFKTHKKAADKLDPCKKSLNEMRVVDHNERWKLIDELLLHLINQNKITQPYYLAMKERIEQFNLTSKQPFLSCFKTIMFKKTFISTLHLNDEEKDNVFKAIVDVAKKIDKLEDEKTSKSFGDDLDKRNEYDKLKMELINIKTVIRECKEKYERVEKKLSEILIKNNFNAQELFILCKQLDADKKVEIMIIDPEDSLDHDLISVMQMRANHAQKKGSEFIIVPIDVLNEILKTDNSIDNATKLSFLHHGKFEFGYVEHIPEYIKLLPNLKEIVLRGCGTAEKPKMYETVYDVKNSGIPYDKKPSVQGTSQLIIQQKEEEGKVYSKATWISWDSTTNTTVRKEIMDITILDKITSNKLNEEQLSKLEDIQGIPLLKHDDSYVNTMSEMFFNKKNVMSSHEINKIKHSVKRARTETVLTSGNDLLSQVVNKMTPEQRKSISVKAYVGGYEVEQGRVLPYTEHAYKREPKALRIGPKQGKR